MKEDYERISDRQTYDLYEEIESLIRKCPWTWQSIGAVAGLVGGVLTPLLGTILTAIRWIINSSEARSVLNILIIILFSLTIPLLVFGAHCLDLLDRKSSRSRQVSEPQLPKRGAASQHDSFTVDDPATDLQPRPFAFKRSSRENTTQVRKSMIRKRMFVALIAVVTATSSSKAYALQQTDGALSRTQAFADTKVDPNEPAPKPPPAALLPTMVLPADITERERRLLERLEQLERRVAELESRNSFASATGNSSATGTKLGTDAAPIVVATTSNEEKTSLPLSEGDRGMLGFFRDTTFNLTFDGYYGYNFNRPVGGISLLRPYDVQSNSFSLNQAALIIESAPNLEKGKRHGFRLDLQYGQATETVQGNAANEPRPQAYRNIWQAYGTYVFEVGRGLTVDFGKYAGSLGYESNYTKDNFNYTRSYFFNFLPFYHFGFRAKYPVSDKVTLMYHLTNGAQQSEDFNGFKSHHVALVLAPTRRVSGQINYYFGQEQRDRNPLLNPTFAPVASQPGLSLDVIRPVPSGMVHIFDTYYTFNVTDEWTLAVEGDYVVNRVFRDSPPATVWGGAAYARYQWTPKFALAGRVTYLSESVSQAGGLFSGVAQALKEHTLTAEYKFADGFLGRAEYRRDFSNQPFFLTEQPGVLKREQNTLTLGLVWWLGRKQGTW